MNQNSIVKIKNGIVLPLTNANLGGVCDSEFNFIQESKFDGWSSKGGFYSVDTSVCHKHERVLYLGFFIQHWGHFLIECLGRVWILQNPEYKDYKIVFLRKGGTFEKQHCQFFELLGKDKDSFVNVDEPTSFDEIVVPSVAYLETDPDLFYIPFRMAVEQCRFYDGAPSKVYFSRTHLKKAKKTELGEKYIERKFKDAGFAICYPEEMSLREQIEIFQRSEHVVCINGTIPLNACLFAGPQLNLTVLNKTSLPHDVLVRVSKLVPIKLLYIDIFFEPICGFPVTFGAGPFWMRFNTNLINYFRDNHWPCDVSVFYKLSFVMSFPVYVMMCGYVFFNRVLKCKIKKILKGSFK